MKLVILLHFISWKKTSTSPKEKWWLLVKNNNDYCWCSKLVYLPLIRAGSEWQNRCALWMNITCMALHMEIYHRLLSKYWCLMQLFKMNKSSNLTFVRFWHLSCKDILAYLDSNWVYLNHKKKKKLAKIQSIICCKSLMFRPNTFWANLILLNLFLKFHDFQLDDSWPLSQSSRAGAGVCPPPCTQWSGSAPDNIYSYKLHQALGFIHLLPSWFA